MAKKERAPDPPSAPQGRCPGCGTTRRITGRGTWEMHSRGDGMEGTERCPSAAKPAPPGAHVAWLRAEWRAACKRLDFEPKEEADRLKQYEDARYRRRLAAGKVSLYAFVLRSLGATETPDDAAGPAGSVEAAPPSCEQADAKAAELGL